MVVQDLLPCHDVKDHGDDEPVGVADVDVGMRVEGSIEVKVPFEELVVPASDVEDRRLDLVGSAGDVEAAPIVVVRRMVEEVVPIWEDVALAQHRRVIKREVATQLEAVGARRSQLGHQRSRAGIVRRAVDVILVRWRRQGGHLLRRLALQISVLAIALLLLLLL